MDYERCGALVVLRRVTLFLVALCAGLIPAAAVAEPWIAVQKGLHCSACHSNQAGGGMRSVYGNVFAQTELAAQRIGANDDEVWTGAVSKWLSLGGNVRAGYNYVDTPNSEEVSEFQVNRATIYIEAHVVPNRVSVYLDQQLAPGGSLNREAYARIKSESGKWHLQAGQFFLPYGWRLQDDTAFTRLVTGINFTNPDRGVQVGYESGAWSTLLSLSNGSGGGNEIDTGKQVSLIATYVRPSWRLGASLNSNDADAGDRTMGNVFVGIRTGPVAWLAQVDRIRDDLPSGARQNGIVSLVEANWLFNRGHNVKITHDWYDPDDDVDEDEQARWSLIYEYSPMQFLQGRFGVRSYDGIPQVDSQNRDEFFAELHGFF